MAIPQKIQVPYKDVVSDDSGFFSRAWREFFKRLKEIVDPLGIERSFNLLNNQASPTKITGLVFDSVVIKQIFIDYLIQRVTSTNERIETGILRMVYLPTTATWSIANMGGQGPNTSGVTFSTNSSGEVFYTSTNIAGDPVTFKLSVRSRTLSGVNLQ